MFLVSLPKQAATHNHNFTWVLKWRQNQLWVSTPKKAEQTYSFSINQSQQLVDCLKHSSVKLVCLEPSLGQAQIELWAQACLSANLPVYIKLPNRIRRETNWLNPWLDTLESFLLNKVIRLLPKNWEVESIFSICQAWYVGNHGKLYRATKLNGVKPNLSQLIEKLN